MTTTVLGGLSVAAFLTRHWQKKPLLVRGAIPGFSGFLDARQLFALAARADAVSRLVIERPRRRQRWELHEGPFADLSAGALPASHWTLLVQGVEGLVPGGWELLRAFSFLPAARVDDLMISYAAPHGSVGAHVDQYDVFLLQGPGRRRWQISRQADQTVDPRAPIKILSRFLADDEFILDPGDLLYLPPGVAHWGVAHEGPCFTYSIGFVAPSHDALIQNFLIYLGQKLEATTDPAALYEDPRLVASAHPWRLGDDMVRSVESLLATVTWQRSEVEEFLGRLLTGPKPNVVFAPPRRPLSQGAWARRLSQRDRGRLQLALPSRGLVRGDAIFLNGEHHRVDAPSRAWCESLFATRALELPIALTEPLIELLYGFYRAGYLNA